MKKLVLSLLLSLIATVAVAAEPGLPEMQRQLDELNQKIAELSSRPAATSTTQLQGPAIRLGGYGEIDSIFREENGNGKGGNTFDPHRFVLYVNADLAEWITLNTELEWEHGADSGKGGEVAVEQSYLDFRLSRPFNVKAGLMLVPLGGVNLAHEPTNYNSSERPELDRYLIPSTWSEMGAGIYGALGDKADYQLLVMNGLNGRNFSAEGIRGGRQEVNTDNNDSKAVVARLELRPAVNLYTNLSLYSGDSADAGKPGARTTIAAVDGSYRAGRFDLAGEYVEIRQAHPERISTEIGDRMSGYWVEGACHILPEGLKSGKLADADLISFLRYSAFDTQQGRLADPSKGSGRYDRSYTTFGVVFKPVTTVSIKADYQIFADHRSSSETALDNNKLQISLGYVF